MNIKRDGVKLKTLIVVAFLSVVAGVAPNRTLRSNVRVCGAEFLERFVKRHCTSLPYRIRATSSTWRANSRPWL